MIMPKKKRMLVTTIVIVSILVIIGIVTCIGLYMTTDLFKSNRELFVKYATGTFSNLNKLFDDDNMNEMKEIFQNNKYEVSSNTEIRYQEGENKENSINNIKLTVNGKVEESQNYDYQDIALRNKEEKIYGIEYLTSNDEYGIRINGIQQFASKNINNKDNNEKSKETLLDELAINSNEENEVNLLNLIAEMNLRNTKIKLTEEENVELQNKYIPILMKNVSEDRFSKKQDVLVTVNEQKINTNSYSLTFTKEQLNNIYIEMLTQLKQDNIILSKFDEMDKIRHQYNVLTNNKNEVNNKEEFIKEIDEKIKEIQSTNIGNDTRKVTVFESNMQPIGLQIEANEYTIAIMTNEIDNIINYEYSKAKTTEKENTINFKMQKISNINDDTINIEYNIVEDDVETTNYLTKNVKFDKDFAKTSIEIGRKNSNSEIKINTQKEEKIVNEFKDKIEFDNKNSVNVNKISEEQKNNIDNIMKDLNNKQIEKVFENISKEEINNILEKLDLKLEKAEEISGEGFISETERNRFNSNFEFYEGNNISKENILKLIDVAKNNLEDIRVTKYKEQNSSEKDKKPDPEEYKLTIKKNNFKENLANDLSMKIKNTENKEYNVRIEYSQKTGLVENIFITVIK